MTPNRHVVVIDHADDRVGDKETVQVIPFVVIESELTAVSVASVDVDDAARCCGNRRSPAVLKFYSRDPGQPSGDKPNRDQSNVAGSILDNSLPCSRSF